MRLLRTIRLDPSDTFVFERAADPGEWAVSGAFMFSDVDPSALAGKSRAAFRGGFLGVASLGWSTLVQIVDATEEDRERLVDTLARQLYERPVLVQSDFVPENSQRMVKRAKGGGDSENDLDRGLQLQFVIGGRDGTSRRSETPIRSYPRHAWPVITFAKCSHTHLPFQARNASSTARRLARRISEYLRDRITPSAPPRRAARTASRTSCGSVFFSP